MVTIIKKEWHQVCSEFTYTVDEATLEEIYPDKTGDEIKELMAFAESGELDIDQLVSDAMDADVYFDWDHVDDDWWTHRKGGYDVTYEIGE